MSPLPEVSAYVRDRLLGLPRAHDLAFIFPGQGSQKAGMGKEIAGLSATARDVFRAADDTLGARFSTLCFEGPDEELTRTANAQPAILATSIAHLVAAVETGTVTHCPAFVAGHSLGEYTALVVAGSLEFQDALLLVRERGRLMEEAGAQGGTMAAIVALNEETVREICDLSGAELANCNSPSQFVIGGAAAAVERACALAKEGGGRSLPVQVSGAFHTSLMAPAADQFAAVIDEAAIRDPKMPVVSNVTARPMTAAAEVRDDLRRQVRSPVLWHQSIETMKSAGVAAFVEIGARVLTAILKRSYPELSSQAWDSAAALASPTNV